MNKSETDSQHYAEAGEKKETKKTGEEEKKTRMEKTTIRK